MGSGGGKQCDIEISLNERGPVRPTDRFLQPATIGR
jgi:hypothetical protein